MVLRPPISTLFPYTTLFRSLRRLRSELRLRIDGHRLPLREFDTCEAGPLEHASELHRRVDRKSTRLNSSHGSISYAVFCLKKKRKGPHTESAVISATNCINS